MPHRRYNLERAEAPLQIRLITDMPMPARERQNTQRDCVTWSIMLRSKEQPAIVFHPSTPPPLHQPSPPKSINQIALESSMLTARLRQGSCSGNRALYTNTHTTHAHKQEPHTWPPRTGNPHATTDETTDETTDQVAGERRHADMQTAMLGSCLCLPRLPPQEIT